MFAIGPAEALVLFALIMLPLFAIFVWALVDALRRSDAQWQAAGQSKVLWAILIAVLGFLGAALYYFIPRPALERVRQREAAQRGTSRDSLR